MRRALLTAGAVLILTAPAVADQVTIEKKTITRDETRSGSTVPTVIVAPNPPPAPQVEIPPPPPRPTMVWLSGNWRWDPDVRNYVWIRGRFAEPPRPQAAWIPGRWHQRPEGWVWEEGHWN
jgi:hypothetical protein